MDPETLAQENAHLRAMLKRAAETERKRILVIIRYTAAQYPTDVFPAIAKTEQHPSRDRVSAQMARHVCAQLEERILEDEETT